MKSSNEKSDALFLILAIRLDTSNWTLDTRGQKLFFKDSPKYH